MYKPAAVICDGGLGGLISLYAELRQCELRDPTRRSAQDGSAVMPLVLTWGGWDESAGPRTQAVAHAAREAGCKVVPISFPSTRTPGTDESLLLVHAAHTSAYLGFDRLVWPVTGGAEVEGGVASVDQVARTTDKALLVMRLMYTDAGDHGRPSFRIETPLADFTDAQAADLALDMDVPIRLTWWWGARETNPAAKFEYGRWMGLLRSAGWADDAEHAGRVA